MSKKGPTGITRLMSAVEFLRGEGSELDLTDGVYLFGSIRPDLRWSAPLERQPPALAHSAGPLKLYQPSLLRVGWGRAGAGPGARPGRAGRRGWQSLTTETRPVLEDALLRDQQDVRGGVCVGGGQFSVLRVHEAAAERAWGGARGWVCARGSSLTPLAAPGSGAPPRPYDAGARDAVR